MISTVRGIIIGNVMTESGRGARDATKAMTENWNLKDKKEPALPSGAPRKARSRQRRQLVTQLGTGLERPRGRRKCSEGMEVRRLERERWWLDSAGWFRSG